MTWRDRKLGISRVSAETMHDHNQPASVRIANAYPTIASGSKNLLVEIREERDFHSAGRFLLTEIRDRVAQRSERVRSRDAAIDLAKQWGYGELIEAVDRTYYSGTTTLTVTMAILVPQDTRSIDARDFRVELRQQLSSDIERTIACGTATVHDPGDGSCVPFGEGLTWIRGDDLHAAIGALPRDQRAWVLAVMACGDVGVSVASFSRVS